VATATPTPATAEALPAAVAEERRSRGTPPGSGASKSERWTLRWELAAVVALIGLAFLLRWPNYLQVPSFTDELEEVQWSAWIAQGQFHSLTDVDPYDGSLFNYLLAGLFVLFGPQLYLPRLFVLVVGC